MKKTKRQKAFEWKHLMAHFKGYGAKKRVIVCRNRKQRTRFNIAHFAKTVSIIIKESHIGDFPSSKPGDKAAVMTKGVWFEYGDMSFRICGLGGGLTRLKP